MFDKNLDGNFIYHKRDDGILILTDDSQGMCMVTVDEKLPTCALIHNLHVEKEYRKLGNGTCLIKEAEIVAFSNGIKVLSIQVKIDSFMFGWYQRMGYKPILSDCEMVTLCKELCARSFIKETE